MCSIISSNSYLSLHVHHFHDYYVHVQVLVAFRLAMLAIPKDTEN